MRLARLALLAVLAVPAVSDAQLLYDSGPPQHRVVHRNTFALRFNPLGLLYDGRFMYRYRLYASESVALRDNFVGVGLAPTASPAFARIGPYLELNPATVFGLWAAFQYVQYFGTFNLFQSFQSAAESFSDRTISSRGELSPGDPLRGYVSSGWELTVGANLTLKVKSVVLRSMGRMVRADMRLRAGDRVYYDQYYDVAAPNQGWYLTNDLDVVWQGLSNKLIAGGRYTLTVPFYDAARHLAPGRDDGGQLDAPRGALPRVHVEAAGRRRLQLAHRLPAGAVVAQAPLPHRPGVLPGVPPHRRRLPDVRRLPAAQVAGASAATRAGARAARGVRR